MLVPLCPILLASFFKIKPWELTLVCVPHLKAVLSTEERTQLDFYGIDRNFLAIEDALTTFLEKLKKVKEQRDDVLHQLQDVKVVINSQTSVEVEPFDKHVPESKDVDFVLLDHDFFYAENEHTVHAFNVFVRRPDWGGLILERMKTSHNVFLFGRNWYLIRYVQGGRAFQFTPCFKPVLDARHTCLIHQTDNVFLMCEEREALKALLAPFI